MIKSMAAVQPSNKEDQSQEQLSWKFFHRPKETWDAMYRDCQDAKESIEFEQYILENDSVGQRFMELFIEKAKQGLKVFLICDTFGSALLTHSPLVDKLRQSGGRMYFYNKIRRWHILTPWRWFPRTHTKTLLIDSQVAYTGGVCMAERMRDWRDTHIRITGPVILQIRQAFDDIESKITHKRRRWKRRTFEMPKDRRFLYFMNRPRRQRHAIYRELSKAIFEAKDYIYITSAFFIPDRRLLRLLHKAHKRGVDIQVIVPKYSDVFPADWVCLSYTPQFLKTGIRMFHYQDTVLHSKTAIIDDKWGTVGSMNFDVISFFHNREANIVTTDKNAITDMKRQFMSDLTKCEELTWEVWKTQIPLWKKIAGHAARTLKVFF